MDDVFSGDPFTIVALTDAINKLRFVPGYVSQLGLFSASSVATTSIAIEEKSGILSLISPTGRGAPGTTLDKSKRTLRTLAVPHFEINDAVLAEEVQNVRAFGSETQLEMLMNKIAERLSVHVDSHAATEEYARVGAIKGIVTYADGTSLNLFTEFGVSQAAEVDFALDAASPASGVLRKLCATVVRTIAGNLDGTPFSGVGALCSDSFFDDLLAHPEVVDSYKNTSMAAILRDGYVMTNGEKIYGAFEFGGIVWINYRGSVGGQSFIDADKCHIFPMGVPGLFRTYYAPADYNETVNTMGQRLYSKQKPMPNDKGWNLDSQMNALQICTRPAALIKGKRT